jgi:hypothetical protein
MYRQPSDTALDSQGYMYRQPRDTSTDSQVYMYRQGYMYRQPRDTATDSQVYMYRQPRDTETDSQGYRYFTHRQGIQKTGSNGDADGQLGILILIQTTMRYRHRESRIHIQTA